jgi:hypothetical protein
MATPGDLTLAQDMYDLYIKAEKAVLTGQAYSIGDRTLTRVDLRWIAAERERWGNLLQTLLPPSQSNNGGIRIQRIVPRGGI